MNGTVFKSALFASLPPPWPEELRPQIRAAVAARPAYKLVVRLSAKLTPCPSEP